MTTPPAVHPVDERSVLTQSFDAWNAALDAALDDLPETPQWPHAVYRLVATNHEGPPKRFILARSEGRTLAIVGLRQIGRHWEQIGHGVMPGATIPALPGCELAALRAARLNIWIGGVYDRPIQGNVHGLYSIPIYRAHFHTDYQQYWKESGLSSFVKNARRYTRTFTFEVDAPDAAAWTIDGWMRRWQTEETLVGADLKIAYDHYREHALSHTFRLLDDGKPVAGLNVFRWDDRRLITHTRYFDETYRKQRVGTRLQELVFEWGAASPYEVFDLGGGHDYKEMWAPEAGSMWAYNVAPVQDRLRHSVARLVRNLRSRNQD